MKDNELRELLANIERKIEAATATIVGGDLKELVERIHDNQDSIERIHKSLDHVQELIEASQSTGRQIYDDAAAKETIKLLNERLAQSEKVLKQRLALPFELPSPAVPIVVGMVTGALIIAVGMLVGSMLLR